MRVSGSVRISLRVIQCVGGSVRLSVGVSIADLSTVMAEGHRGLSALFPAVPSAPVCGTYTARVSVPYAPIPRTHL